MVLPLFSLPYCWYYMDNIMISKTVWSCTQSVTAAVWAVDMHGTFSTDTVARPILISCFKDTITVSTSHE